MKYYLLTFLLAVTLLGCKNDSQDTAENATPETAPAVQQPASPAGEATPNTNPSNFQFPDIEGKLWKLSKYEYDGKDFPPFDNSSLTLRIEGEKATGNAGCNDFNGKVALKENGSVAFSGIAATKMRCPQRMTQELRFLELLESAQTYEVNLVFLKLKGPKGMLTFRNDGK